MRASVRSRLGRPTRASGEHGRASRAGARSAVPSRARHLCFGTVPLPRPRLPSRPACGGAGRGRVWPNAAPPGSVLRDPPHPVPRCLWGAWPVKHRFREAPLPAPRAQARFAVVGRVFRGLRGREGAWVPGAGLCCGAQSPTGSGPSGAWAPRCTPGPGSSRRPGALRAILRPAGSRAVNPVALL